MERVFNLPDLGEGLTDGEVVRWLVAVGDQVNLNQPLVEVETAKAAVELPSPWAGTITKLHADEGDTVEVGAPLIAVAVAGSAPAAEPNGAAPPDEERQETLVGPGPRSEARRRRVTASAGAPAATARAVAGVTMLHAKATPPVRKYAKDRGVELDLLVGTGKDGRVTRDDVDAALAGRAPTAPAAASPAPAIAPQRPRRSAGERGEERVPVRGTRRAIAAQMVASVAAIPHVTEFLTVDATELLALRGRLRGLPQAEGVRLTPLAIVGRALCVAVKAFPLMNSSWADVDGGKAEIVLKDYVHLGIATDTENGLVVPNVKDADTLGVLDLAAEISRLTELSRARSAAPADLTGGTITITNVGGFGVETGTPIINMPECAIVATGLIAPRPWVVDGELTVRSLMTVSVSFDHRVVDGAYAARFLSHLRDLLEDPALLSAF